MKKVGTWLLNNMQWLFCILVVLVGLGVVGGVMLSSKNSYKEYESAYKANDLEVRSLYGAQPIYIEIDDNFKSENNNKFSLKAEDLTVQTTQESYLVNDYIDLTEKGGSISASLSLKEKAFVDIDFVIATEYEKESVFGIKDLLSNVQFIINGEVMEEEVDLEESGFHHLVMVSFALPEGDVKVEIKNTDGKASMMPQLKEINLFSSALLEPAQAE